MFAIESIATPLPGLALIDDGAASRVELVPSRGGMVTRFTVAGREVLYLDPATLVDLSKNVRGGIPVLFPIAGKLAHDVYIHEGRTYPLKQHGFARNRAWTETARSVANDARVTLTLTSDDATRAAFPWDFEVAFTYVLHGATLLIEQSYRNRSTTPMPLHAGFHPYFRVDDASKAKVTVATDATRAMDNTTGETGAFTGLDLTRKEVDLHLLDHHRSGTVVDTGDGHTLALEVDPSFLTWVVWTLAGKDFVCVEPWMAPAHALETGDGLRHLAAGAEHRARFGITAH